LAASPPPVPAGRAHQRENSFDHGFADRQPPHQALRRHQFLGRHRRLGAGFVRAGRFKQNFPLGFAIRIADVDLHQEAVELRFGQRIGAFLLQRILRGEARGTALADRAACRRW